MRRRYRQYTKRLDKKSFKMRKVLVARNLPPHKCYRMIGELAARQCRVSFSIKTSYCRATIYNWVKKCKESNDFDMLVHKECFDKDTFRVLSKRQKDALMRWRFDNVDRSV